MREEAQRRGRRTARVLNPTHLHPANAELIWRRSPDEHPNKRSKPKASAHSQTNPSCHPQSLGRSQPVLADAPRSLGGRLKTFLSRNGASMTIARPFCSRKACNDVASPRGSRPCHGPCQSIGGSRRVGMGRSNVRHPITCHRFDAPRGRAANRPPGGGRDLGSQDRSRTRGSGGSGPRPARGAGRPPSSGPFSMLVHDRR